MTMSLSATMILTLSLNASTVGWTTEIRDSIRDRPVFCVLNVLALLLNAILFSAGASYQYLLSERDVHLRTHGNGNSPPASEKLLKLSNFTCEAIQMQLQPSMIFSTNMEAPSAVVLGQSLIRRGRAYYMVFYSHHRRQLFDHRFIKYDNHRLQHSCTGLSLGARCNTQSYAG